MQYKTTLHAIISKFNLLQNILAAKYICITTELRILNSNVKFGAKNMDNGKNNHAEDSDILQHLSHANF